MTQISAVRTHRLRLPLRFPFVTALRRTEQVDTLLVEVVDTDGRRGWGEAAQVWQVTGESVVGAEACVAQMLAPVLVGQPLANWPDMTDRLARVVARNGGAKSAVETALLDLVCRAADVSMADLLSQPARAVSEAAVPEAAVPGAAAAAGAPGAGLIVTTDVTVSATDLAATVHAARQRVADGFTTLKLKVGTDAALDVARVIAVRREVGDDIMVRLDANQGWTRDEAVWAMRALEEAQVAVEFLEQPVAGEDVEGLAWVRRRVDTPVVADEAVFTMTDVHRVVRLEAADGINVKLAKAGGPLAAARQLRFTQEAGLTTMVGSMMESDIGVAAALHVAVAGQASLVADLDAGWWLRRPAPMTGLTYGDDATVRIGPGTGLGVVPLLGA